MGTDKSKTRGLAGLCVGKRAGRRVGAQPIVLQLSGMTQRNCNGSRVFCAQADETFERWN